MILRLNLFWKELLLFGLTLMLGVFSANNYTPLIKKSIIEPPSFTWNSIIVFIIFISLFSLLVIKFKNIGRVSFRLLLLLVVFSGSHALLGSALNYPFDIIFAILAVLIFVRIRNVLIHDLGMILGIAGVSSILGISISPGTAVILLIFLSFYDIFAVYWTKHMVYLARGMMESGAIFGFIIPFEFKDFFYHSHEAKHRVGEKFMILGSGDIGLPLILASSVAVASISQALIVVFFALLGLFLTHLIFINRSKGKPMAALPPIATLTIIGYLISQL